MCIEDDPVAYKTHKPKLSTRINNELVLEQYTSWQFAESRGSYSDIEQVIFPEVSNMYKHTDILVNV